MNHKVNRVLKLFLLGFIFTFGLLFLPTQVTIFADDRLIQTQAVKTKIDMSTVRWDIATLFYYDGTEKGIELRNVPSMVTPVYQNNRATQIGEYRASVSFSYDENLYELSSLGISLEKSWFITQGNYDTSTFHFYDHSMIETGEPLSIGITGQLPEGLTVSYEGNQQTAPGEYVVTATFSGDFVNYKQVLPMTATMKILRKALRTEDHYSIESTYGLDPFLTISAATRSITEYRDIDLTVAGTYQEVKGAFSIQLLDGQSMVQPNHMITVRVPIPKEHLEAQNLQIYDYSSGRLSSVEAVREDDQLVFITNSLSDVYLVIGTRNTYTNNDYWKVLLMFTVCLIGGLGIVAGVRIRRRKRNLLNDKRYK